MFPLLRKYRMTFVLAVLAAVALRVVFLLNFQRIDGDSLLYGDLAKNLLSYGVLGMSGDGVPVPSYIRLPGYPVFLAAIWRTVGMEHYTAVFIAQIIADIGTCFVVADIARRTISDRAAVIAFWLAALCPFIAAYAATPLTETLAVFFAALAIDFAVAGLDDLVRGRVFNWIGCGLAIAASILLRPDGGILLGAVGLYLLYRIAIAGGGQAAFRRNALLAGIMVAVFALAPLVPWTVRNWHAYHRFQPLAPRYANEPYESFNPGFQRWVKTWMVEYVSVYEVYWNLPGNRVDPHVFPRRTFDSAEERRKTEELFAAYNETLDWTDTLDSELGRIADARIRRAPLRYYMVLPALRIADMWFRPRTDNFGLNDYWWDFRNDPEATYWGLFLAGLNLFFVLAALYALIQWRNIRYVGLLVLFVVIRSAFLGTLENPETRYTLECYPVILVLAAAGLSRLRSERAG
jgi:4-amino-4-deoxy-L-arabinose transferase-like glycosyltransferase